jgi:hypothetical protein
MEERTEGWIGDRSVPITCTDGFSSAKSLKMLGRRKDGEGWEWARLHGPNTSPGTDVEHFLDIVPDWSEQEFVV